MGRGWIAAVFAACAVFAFFAWVQLGRPVAIPDAPTAHAACVSYAPFQGSETPFNESFVVPKERVLSDLQALATFTDCVRTYATTNGLDQVPEAAQKVGLKVLQGIWIGRKDSDNVKEMARGVALARQFPDTITGVIVGNEALLRREITADRLAVLIQQVKGQIAQPVTYADVWEFWEQNPSLAQAVDFITIHLLPYWEDQPTPVDDAIAHVVATHQHMEQVFPGKKLLIGEIGWPSAGRQRQGAEATLVNETRFIRGVIAAAAEHQWDYNLIESFDQPWKRALEGTAGGYWGLFTDDREPKVTLQGPLAEEAGWMRWAGLAAALGIGLGGLAASSGRRADLVGWGVSLLGGLASGGALSFLARHIEQSSRQPWEWILNGAIWCLMALTSVIILRALCQQTIHREDAALLGWLRRLALIVASVGVIGHVFGGRYRDFPSSMIVIAAVGFLLLRLRTDHDGVSRKPEDSWLAGAIVLGAPVVAISEGWLNGDALTWCALVLSLGLAALPWPWQGGGYGGSSFSR
ncbi:glycoside hydrolase family 17 protein [Insolitispirillum peregrinum]|uniref:Endo-1,3-beta-glucanase btgC n=1 Tax=Insolitispirillum peregrinum TaxID=80876 RepID=A0A1N7PVX8_9PROT|nr:hypothetical protein [Insolitispirillum peregrinum]SIT14774.1 Exo-beta-1,3-glucanase, GH17 family [Insolitispirillum peregrinum]